MANIVILMGSPRQDGNTAKLARAFAEGAGIRHRVELIHVAGMKISPCRGCNACFHTQDHACVQKDDMQGIYTALAGADILVIATPLYFYSVSAQLKQVIDRLHNPVRNTFPIRKLVLLAVGGNPDPGIFQSLLQMYRSVLHYFRLEDGGVITVPGVRGRTDIVDHPALQQARELGRSLE